MITSMMIWYGNAQTLRTDKTDEFTHDVTKVTNTYVLGSADNMVGKLKGYIGHINDVYALYVYSTTDLGCGGTRDNYMIILFDDGTTYKLSNDIADISCADYASSIYVFDPSMINKPITKIRVRQSRYYADFITTDGEYTLQQLITVVE